MKPRRFLVTGGSQGIGAASSNVRAPPGTRWYSPAAMPSRIRRRRVDDGRASDSRRTSLAPRTTHEPSRRCRRAHGWRRRADQQRRLRVSRRDRRAGPRRDARDVRRERVWARRRHQSRRAADERVRRRRHHQHRVDVRNERFCRRHLVRRAANGRCAASANAGRPSSGRTAFGSSACARRRCRPTSAAAAGGTTRTSSTRSDIADTIMAALDMPRRALWPELAVFANNPWKES